MDEIYVCPRAFRAVHQIPLSNSRHFEEPAYRAKCSPLRKPLAGWGQIQAILSFVDHLLTTRPYILQTYECLFQTREFRRSTLPADTNLPHPKQSFEYAARWSTDRTLQNTSSPTSSHALAGGSIHCEAGPHHAGFCSHEKTLKRLIACATSMPCLWDRSQRGKLYRHLPVNTSHRIFRGR